jgi:acetylornithine deacetylase/succinyl-diaminopimelate desuccinylase-like protein
MPETGVDALEAANRILAAIYASRDSLKKTSSRVPGISHPSLNVGLIRGGINTNVVPDRVTFRIDRRIVPEEAPEQVERELRELIVAAAGGSKGIKVDVRRILLASPLVPQPGVERLIAAIQGPAKNVLGADVAATGVPLYTDARHYSARGIPTVLYGAGPRTLLEANGHNADENLRLSDLRAATRIVARAVADLCKS